MTVTLQPVKSGAPVGRIRSVLLPNGQKLGSQAPPPRAGAPPQNQCKGLAHVEAPDRGDRRADAVAAVVACCARASLEQPRHDRSSTTAADRTGPSRDLTGTWDAGGAGIAPRGSPTAPLTPWGDKKITTYKPGDGPRAPSVIGEINDPLSTMCDPAGFPRNLLFELRPFQVVHTPNQVLMLYMFEKRFRTIWTDGRALPKDPDPRWYGYSVGRWEDDSTFVVDTIGLDEKTWLDNAGNPHSNDLRVEERYHRVNMGQLELDRHDH